MKVKRFKGQNYDKIKRDLQNGRNLFTDPEFPPSNGSLWYDQPKIMDIEWKRMGELCELPKFVEGGRVPHEANIVQGALGDCWLIAAVTAALGQKRLWKLVVPDPSEQEWDERRPGAYRGIFHFRFWHFGDWYDVVVDDYLPVRHGRLVFARSRIENEFWCPLLEKAYAKFHGCYERLISGSLAEALVDMTGGIPQNQSFTRQCFTMEDGKRQVLQALQTALASKALILAAVNCKQESEKEKETDCGLLKGHAYSVNAIKHLSMVHGCTGSGIRDFFKLIYEQKDQIHLVLLRNPWGRKEWSGPWSNGSDEWRRVDSIRRRKFVSIFKENNGEFWMAFEDFLDNFGHITICHLHLPCVYKEHAFEGRWNNGDEDPRSLRAGGSINDKDTFLLNPQYLMQIQEGDYADIIISLLQDQSAVTQPAHFLSIGITVIRVEDNRRYRLHDLRGLDTVGMTDFVNCRSNFLRLSNLSVGRYIIIPSTYKTNQEGNYYLRIYTAHSTNVHLIRQDCPRTLHLPLPLMCCFTRTRPFAVVTRMKIEYARELPYSHWMGYYVSVTTDSGRWTSRVIWNCTEPHWNWSIVIYRHSLESASILRLWSVIPKRCVWTGKRRRIVRGMVKVDTPIDHKIHQHSLTVTDAHSKSVGVITVSHISSTDVTFGL